MEALRTTVILNPNSRRGKSGRRWHSLEPHARKVFGDVAVLKTERPNHATELTRQALHDGAERILAVGGDGTLHEIVNGYFENGVAVNPSACIGLVPLGTGCDYARSIDVQKGLEAFDALREGGVHSVDVGLLRYCDESGETQKRYMVNACHTGLGGKVAATANASSKAFGGFITFLLALIGARITTKAVSMSVTVDGQRHDGRYLDALVANGQFDGGGIHMAPRAKLNDGVFELYLIGDFTYWETAMNLRLLYSGRADEHPKVAYARGKQIIVEPEQRVMVSPDGETAGWSPIQLDLVPTAVRMMTGTKPIGL